MFNPEPSPPQPPSIMPPPPTPLNRETTSLRRRHRTRTPLPLFAEVVDVDVDVDVDSSSSSFTPIAVDLNDDVSASNSGPVNVVIKLSDTEDDDEVRILKFSPANTSFGKRNKRKASSSSEGGECSNTAPFVCEICTETKLARESFSIAECFHVYCATCVAQYVEAKLDENVVNIPCPVPACRGLLEAEDCRRILSPRILDRWGKALCEAVISAEEKFYCPFADCSALMVRGSEDGDIKESECPNCRRLFCALCKVPWHDGISCEEFQKLNADEREREDIMLINLANQMHWKRCPRCRFYVAKSEGCMYMRCRCGNSFCYNCGAPNLTGVHHCSNCKR